MSEYTVSNDGASRKSRSGRVKGGTLLAVLALGCVASLLPSRGVVARGVAGEEPREVIIRLDDDEDEEEFDDDYEECEIEDALQDFKAYRVRIADGVSTAQFLSTVTQDQRVQYAETVKKLTTGLTTRQYTSVFDAGTEPRGYVNQKALKQAGYKLAGRTTLGEGVTVAILDTGISARPPLLAGKLVPGWNAVDGNSDAADKPNGLDDNGNGLKDEATGHGTMVAGIVALMAPEAKLMPVKVLNSDGIGDLWTIAEGIQFAAQRGAKVMNLSFGFQDSSKLLQELVGALEDLDVVTVTSAGNANTDRPQYPAHYSKVVTVAALTAKNRKASFSNYGSDVDLSAPGVGIRSTYWNGRFAVWSGTSFAAPFVTAEATLMRAAAPGLEADKIADLMEDSARNIDRQSRRYRGKLGEGCVNVDAGVAAAIRED